MSVVRGLVVEGEGDRVEEVEEVAFLPAPVMRQIHAELRETGRDSDGGLPLRRPAVPDECLPYRLRSVLGDLDTPGPRDAVRRSGQPVERREPRHGVAVGRFKDEDPRSVRGDPVGDEATGFGMAAMVRKEPQRPDPRRDDAGTPENREPEVAKSRIKSEDRSMRVHGRSV